MKIAVLTAMDKELQLLLSLMSQYKELEIGRNRYFVGTIGDKEVIAGKCGIGKVNAAVNTYRLIQNTSPDIIINTGVAGGASDTIKIGDVLVADSIAYHDVWCGPGTEYGAADGFPTYFRPPVNLLAKCRESNIPAVFGLICSGDKFIHTAEEIKEISSHFPQVVAVDMESASIAQVGEMCGVPVLIVRVMSDTPGKGDNISQYKDFWGEAPKKTFECVERIIKEIL